MHYTLQSNVLFYSLSDEYSIVLQCLKVFLQRDTLLFPINKTCKITNPVKTFGKDKPKDYILVYILYIIIKTL